MGVLRFFYWIYKNHRDVLSTEQDNFKREFDALYIDLNAVIHPVCQRLFGYGGKKSLLFKQSSKNISDSEIFKGVCQEIEKLKNISNPKKFLFVAIDGVAPMCKTAQQRQRRFQSVNMKKDFDSNKITVGTEFMFLLSFYIKGWLEYKSKSDWKNIKIILSDEKVVGEGEHKLIHHAKKMLQSSFKCCIYSPDADLIMISLGAIMKINLPNNIVILRENIYRDSCSNKYFFVDIQAFKFKLFHLMEKRDFHCISDFILMCFIMGNDFLPHSPSLEITTTENNGLDILIEMYKSLSESLTFENEKGKWCLNRNSLFTLFFLLHSKESEFLIHRAKRRGHFPDLLLESCCYPEEVNGKIKRKFNITKFRNAFYNEKAQEKPITLCLKYFEMLLFNLRYYLDDIPDFEHFFPYHYSPFFKDLKKNILSFENTEFIPHSPLSPFEQLLAVFPSESKYLLPSSLQKLMDKDSSIKEFYPFEFSIDLEGVKNEYEGKVILPFVDVKKLREEYKKNTCFTERENDRNAVGSEIVFN
jgi:5'-3' exonuclease